MKHADTLKLLFPLELTGVFDDDIALEGKQLDDAQASADVLLQEMFADKAYNCLTDWERVCGLAPDAGDPLQSRRDAVIRKVRELGGLSRDYFIALAASIGWTITIDELQPFMCGWNRCGDDLNIEESQWIWRVNARGLAYYAFRAGVSCTSERLGRNPSTDRLEELLNDLKPAHTYVIFNYD
jgi:uncharacterized protein YmfQ (DUF2313 family)